MRCRRILCPVDLSQSSIAALDHAASLALELGAHLHIVNVDETPPLCGAASLSRSQRLADRRQRLEDFTPPLRGVTYEHHLLRGQPAAEILRFARLYGVDLVVMGRADPDRKSGPRAAEHDGVTQTVIRESRCPVMIVGESAPVEAAAALLF
jgi:nucleotide-binding universal stress UspA family protein